VIWSGPGALSGCRLEIVLATVSTVIQDTSVPTFWVCVWVVGCGGGILVIPGKRLDIRFCVDVVLFQAGTPFRPLVKPTGVALALVRTFASLLASGNFCISSKNFSQLSLFAAQIALA
jgi:hypothetical protein